MECSAVHVRPIQHGRTGVDRLDGVFVVEERVEGAVAANQRRSLRIGAELLPGELLGLRLTERRHRLVKITGRAEEVGRPMLYGTTPEFLRVFGIASLSDLPQAKDLR